MIHKNKDNLYQELGCMNVKRSNCRRVPTNAKTGGYVSDRNNANGQGK